MWEEGSGEGTAKATGRGPLGGGQGRSEATAGPRRAQSWESNEPAAGGRWAGQGRKMLSLEQQAVSVYPKGWGTNGEVGRSENTQGAWTSCWDSQCLQGSAENTDATGAWMVLKGPRRAEQYMLSPHPQIHVEQSLSMWQSPLQMQLVTERPHCRRVGPVSNDRVPVARQRPTHGGAMEAEVR